MSQKSCCVPGCKVTTKDGVTLHRFPNPETSTEKFNIWVSSIGGNIADLDAGVVFRNIRVCDKHFEDIHKYPKNRLSSIAVPRLHLMSDHQLLHGPEATRMPVAPITCASYPSTSNVLPTYTTTSMTDHQLLHGPEATRMPVAPITCVSYPSTSNVLPTYTTTSMTDPQLLHEPEATRMPVAPITCASYPSTSNVLPTYTTTSMTGYQLRDVPGLPESLKKAKTRKAKAPHLSLAQHKKYKTLVKQLEKCERDKNNFRKKHVLAKRMKRTEAFKIISKHMTKPAKIFCHMQASQSGKKKQGRRFSLNEKILALSLYKPSPRAYRLLSKICVLPSRRTLQNLLHKVNLKPGINNFIFEHIKRRVDKMAENHKFCTLIFDEMAIGPSIAYDKKNDKIIGLVDNGERSIKEYCDHVLVFMIRGVIKKYKQPLAYYFCSGSTKAAELKAYIKDIIIKIQETGLKIVATVCDQGASNLSAISSLLNETKGNYLRNNCAYREGFFEIGNDKIFPIYDPPHLMKGVRNNLLTKNLKYNLKGKECTAKWQHIIALYKRCPGYSGVKLVPKLTAHHVLPELIPKMRVKHCTQVFSKTVGVALGCMAGLGALEKESTETADLLLFFDDLFDSINGSYSQIRDGKIYRSAVTASSPHHKLWNYSIPILKSMKFINANNQGVVPSLASWIKTIENFKRIVKYLHSKGVNSLLLRHFNQDPIENFFGAIRAHGCANTMPTASAFEGAYKTLLINNISSPHSVGSNCEKDDSVCFQSLKYFLVNHGDNNPPTECVDEIENDHLNMTILDTEVLLTSKAPSDLEKCAAIGYCSGWIAYLAKKNIYKSCAVCKNDLESEGLHSFHQYGSKKSKSKEFGSKKWLCYPTRPLFDFFAQVENLSNEILKKYPNKRNLANYIGLIVTITLDITFLSCQDHKEVLSKYLVNKSTIFFINNWCKEISNILTGKSPFWDVTDEMKEKAHRHYSKNKGRKRRHD